MAAELRGEQFAMNDNMSNSTVASESENIPEERHQLEAAVAIYDQPEQSSKGEELAINDNIAYFAVARDRRCRKGATERESENIPEERHQLEAAETIYDWPEQSESSEGEELAINDNIDRRHREGGTERDIPEERQLETAEVIYDQPLQSLSGEQFAMNDNAAYSTTVARGRRHREDATERESGEELLLETAGAIYDRPEQAAGEEQFAMSDNMAYSTVATDRRCREGATGERQLETDGAIYDQPVQAPSGEQFAMDDNMAYSTTVARDRRHREGVTVRESGDILVEEQLETNEVICDRPEQAAGREQFAMNDNMAYSTTIGRNRRCRGVTERENVEEVLLETATSVIYNRPEQAAGGEQFAMNDNAAYSTLARDRRQREGATKRENGAEILLETATVIYDKPEQAAGAREQFSMKDNMAYSTTTTTTIGKDRRHREDVPVKESEDIPEEEREETTRMIYDRPQQAAGGEQFAVNENMAYSTVLLDKTETVNM